jgi:diacylglycerol kinase (ATP)
VRIALIINPRAGSGRAALVAQRLESLLKDLGCQPVASFVHPRERDTTTASTRAALEGAHAVAIVGGDGTLHHSLPELLHARVPVYHVPLGTENLFARALRTHHTRDLARAANRLHTLARTHAHQHLDVLQLTSGEHRCAAAIMCTVGPDASVVHRLARVRTGAISHASYIAPALREAFAPHLPSLTVIADGVQLASSEPGWLVVANLPHYARGINPCRNARATDAQLDVAFFPARSAASVLAWYARCAARMQLEADSSLPGARAARARSVTISASAPIIAQADGDAIAGLGTTLTISVLPGVLPVLADADMVL